MTQRIDNTYTGQAHNLHDTKYPLQRGNEKKSSLTPSFLFTACTGHKLRPGPIASKIPEQIPGKYPKGNHVSKRNENDDDDAGLHDTRSRGHVVP